MVIQPDIIIRSLLQDGFTALRQDPTPIQDIFGTHDESVISDIQTYFANNEVPVRHGWAKTAGEVGIGAIYISTASSQETATRQFLGSDAPDQTFNLNINDTYLGTFFDTIIRIHCKSPNVVKTHYMATIAKWILIGNRITLENQNGLAQQVISLTDLVPERAYLPDFVFTRDILYQCTHLDIVDITVATGLVQSITVAPNETVDSTQVFHIP